MFFSGFHLADTYYASKFTKGIWALEFFAKNFDNNIILNLECIDITAKQFPQKDPGSLPSNIHFLVNSVLDLPSHWSNTFVYAHQRLLYVAMNESRWQLAIEQLFRCLEPGGWLELVEVDVKGYELGGGPHSKRLFSLISRLYAENGVIVDLSVYLLDLLEKTGFLEIHCERRIVPVRRDSSEDGISSQEFYDLWMGMKGPILAGHGYGIIETSEEFDTMMEGSLAEWQDSQDAWVTFYNITARKPEDV